jgi:predicted NUDIX family NTP pyrophosphohydrolase
MAKQTAGILLYRVTNKEPEFFLVHPGGPLWKNKDAGAWSIPKGEFNEDEEPLSAAKREFKEETGQMVDGNFIHLKPVKYKSGKIVYAWALEGNIDASKIVSNTFLLEWPPRSKKFIQVPEVDCGAWFRGSQAREKILPAQLPLLEELIEFMNEK